MFKLLLNKIPKRADTIKGDIEQETWSWFRWH